MCQPALPRPCAGVAERGVRLSAMEKGHAKRRGRLTANLVAAVAVALALPASAAAFEPLAAMGGSGVGKLGVPLGVAIDGVGSVYAAEHVNQRVSRFSTAGVFDRGWGFNVTPGGGRGLEVCTEATGCRPGEPGGRAGQLSFPDGVAADGAGNLYVADANGRVSQFTTQGAFVRAFGLGVVPGGGEGLEVCTPVTGCKRGRSGAGAGALLLPSAVAADPSGAIYVSDGGPRRIGGLGEPSRTPRVRNLF